MTTLLAHWLNDNRQILLTRWRALLDTAPQTAHNGHHTIVHQDGTDTLLAAIYDGFIRAADGDYAPLEGCLRMAGGLPTTPDENELCGRLASTFQLRQIAWSLIFTSGITWIDARTLLDDLETLIEHTALTLTTHWTSSAKAVTHQLHQAEFLAASLAKTSAQADHIALQMSKLYEISSSLASSLEPNYLIDTVGSKLAEVLDVAHVAVWLSDGESLLYAAQDERGSAATTARVALDAAEDLISRAYQLQETLVEKYPDPATQGDWYQLGCAVLAVPILTHNQVNGVIVLQDPDVEKHFEVSQQSFLNSIANQLAIALENARLYKEVREFNTILEQRIAERTSEVRTEHRMLETLHQIALEVSSTLDLDTLLQNCLMMLAELIGVEHGSLMLVEADTGHLVTRAVLGRQDLNNPVRFPVGQGVVGWVAQQREAALINNIQLDDRWVVLPRGTAVRKQTGSMIAVPLIVQHELSGVMVLSHEHVGYFNEDHLRLLSASAGAIALGVHNAILYDQVQQQFLRQGEMLRSERRSMAQSTAILQSLSDGVIVCDNEGAILIANRAAARILGRSVEELVAWRLPDLIVRIFGIRSKGIPLDDLLIHPYDKDSLARSYAANFQVGMRMVRLTLNPVIASEGEVIGAVAVFRDISREVESERLKDEFIGTVSHELRTPMTSIKGFAQLLAMGSIGPINDMQREFIGTIHTNADRMIAIINDLLDITKIEAGSIDLELRPLHLAEALGNIVLDLQAKIQARGHELSIHIPLGLPLVQVDAKRFDQILFHVVSNAIKYTPYGGKIIIEAREITEQAIPETFNEALRLGRYVQIDVRDTGVGIAPDEQELVFQRFYRTENPLKTEAGGTGLGLSLVRSLVKLFGGRVWLHSEVDQGTIFTIVVPAVQPKSLV